MSFSPFYFRILIFFVLAPQFFTATTTAKAEEAKWTSVAPGLEIGIVRLTGGLFPGEVTLLRTSLKHLRPRVVRAEEYKKRRGNTEWYAKKTGASLCINANFFDTQGNPLGLVVSRGVVYKPIQRGGSLLTGLFLVYRDKLAIVPREDKHSGFGLEAIQAGPRLVSHGTPVGDSLDGTNQSRRSGICLISPTSYMIFIASSSLRGASLRELSQLLAHPSVGCENALNFDGGGSSQLYVSTELLGARKQFQGMNVVGRDPVPTALCLFPAR